MSKQQIYDTLCSFGFTYEARISMMANWEEESNNESMRLQGDFSSFRTLSKAYASKVESGAISRQQFAYDNKGWGIAQFTLGSRKLALYDFWQSYGGSIGDLQMQLDFVLFELKSGFSALYKELCTSHDLQQLVKDILYIYENPAEKINNYNRRLKNAYNLKAEFPEKAVDTPTKPFDTSTETYWPPRMICKGMTGDDVIVLQAVLKARGYECNTLSGEFDERTKNRVLAFQAENIDLNGNRLDTDGIVGNKTWGALLKI